MLVTVIDDVLTHCISESSSVCGSWFDFVEAMLFLIKGKLRFFFPLPCKTKQL